MNANNVDVEFFRELLSNKLSERETATDMLFMFSGRLQINVVCNAIIHIDGNIAETIRCLGGLASEW